VQAATDIVAVSGFTTAIGLNQSDNYDRPDGWQQFRQPSTRAQPAPA
jgi:hypothetical protein